MTAHDKQHGVADRQPMDMARRLKLIWGAAGIYFFFIQNSKLYQGIFRYRSPDGKKFSALWLLHFLEALVNVIVSGAGRHFQGATLGLPQNLLFLSGFCTAGSKYC